MLLAAIRKGKKSIELSDSEIVDRVRKGDTQQFRELVERYQTRAFHVAKRVLRSDEDAEEVVQEAFVKAYLSLDSFKGQSKFYTWFYRIVFNMSVDVKRKQQRRGGDAVEYIEDLGSFDTKDSVDRLPETNVANREMLALVAEALKELSDDHREVLVMREFDGLSYDEIADLLKVNRGTVMSRLFYARKNLQALLAKLDTTRGVESSDSVASIVTESASKA
jgi:RNA polymerase sigma-70 factor (ECF subfamily)